MVDELTADFVIADTFVGGMTVEAAEAWAAARGEPFTPLEPDALERLNDADVTLEQATALIAGGSTVEMARRAALFSNWADAYMRDTPDIASAARLLWEALRRGELEATGFDHWHPKDAAGDPARRQPISRVELADLTWNAGTGLCGTRGNSERAPLPSSWAVEETVRFSKVLVERVAVMRLVEPGGERPTPVPRGRAEVKAAKALAIKRAKDIIANAPGGMTLPELRAYVQEREPSLSRNDIDRLKDLYRDQRRPGENARTLAYRKSPK